MKLAAVAVCTVFLVDATVCVRDRHQAGFGPRETAARPAELSASLARLPAAFVPNLGQWDERVRYLARVRDMTVFLEQEGWTFTLLGRGDEKAKAGRVVAGKVTEPTSRGL